MEAPVMEIGFVVTEPGSTVRNRTGTWRSTVKPILDQSKCIRCALCYVYCPEPAICIKDDYYIINYDYCKGCGLCAEECPVKAVEMVLEG